MGPLTELVDTIDRAVRRGEVGLARTELTRLRRTKIPRPLRVQLAFISWRVDRPAFGIRLLNPIIRSDRPSAVQPSERELGEYAQCLVRLGATEEAEALLRGIGAPKLPETLLYLASARISRWDYAGALPLLSRYIKSSATRPYQRLVGKVNLAAALVATGDHLRAEHLLRELVHDLSLRKHHLLFANALVFAAQNFILQAKWKNVESYLAQARGVLQNSGTVDEFLIRKWSAIAEFLKDRPGKKTRGGLQALRAEAEAREQWETVRQCDQFEAKARRDERLLFHLYFGTPFPLFRKRLLSYYGEDVQIPEQYTWQLGGRASSRPVLDLRSGSLERGTGDLRSGFLIKRLLDTLASDFYRPFRITEIHFSLYPNEHYHPVHSPHRVHEVIHRLRHWLREERQPLALAQRGQAYALSPLRPCSLILGREGGGEKHGPLLARLRRDWPRGNFSVMEASERLKIPYRTLFRALQELCSQNALVREGQTRATRYHFPG